MKILCKFASRERPARFWEVFNQWLSKASQPDRLHWLFSFDKDDPTMANMGKRIEQLVQNRTIEYGLSKSKVHAINRDIEKVDHWDVLIVLSDDMWPMVQGWDDVIEERLSRTDGDCLLWFPDQKQKDIVTLPIITRIYYNRDGHVYYPSYKSVFPDNEQTDKARARGRLEFEDLILAEHRHPANVSSVKPDALYKRNETQFIWDRDRENYEQRKAQGFPA